MALALMLILEGVLPFLAPNLWRDTFRRITQMTDGQIRFVGLSSMLVGLLILCCEDLVAVMRWLLPEYIEDILPGRGDAHRNASPSSSGPVFQSQLR